MSVQIHLGKCQCGEQTKLKHCVEWHGMKVEVVYSYCPKRRWYNFWKHQKDREHAYMPYPVVNKMSVPTPKRKVKVEK